MQEWDARRTDGIVRYYVDENTYPASFEQCQGMIRYNTDQTRYKLDYWPARCKDLHFHALPFRDRNDALCDLNCWIDPLKPCILKCECGNGVSNDDLKKFVKIPEVSLNFENDTNKIFNCISRWLKEEQKKYWRLWAAQNVIVKYKQQNNEIDFWPCKKIDGKWYKYKMEADCKLKLSDQNIPSESVQNKNFISIDDNAIENKYLKKICEDKDFLETFHFDQWKMIQCIKRWVADTQLGLCVRWIDEAHLIQQTEAICEDSTIQSTQTFTQAAHTSDPSTQSAHNTTETTQSSHDTTETMQNAHNTTEITQSATIAQSDPTMQEKLQEEQNTCMESSQNRVQKMAQEEKIQELRETATLCAKELCERVRKNFEDPKNNIKVVPKKRNRVRITLRPFSQERVKEKLWTDFLINIATKTPNPNVQNNDSCRHSCEDSYLCAYCQSKKSVKKQKVQDKPQARYGIIACDDMKYRVVKIITRSDGLLRAEYQKISNHFHRFVPYKRESNRIWVTEPAYEMQFVAQGILENGLLSDHMVQQFWNHPMVCKHFDVTSRFIHLSSLLNQKQLIHYRKKLDIEQDSCRSQCEESSQTFQEAN